jgi:hypothetical protein
MGDHRLYFNNLGDNLLGLPPHPQHLPYGHLCGDKITA